MPTGSPTAHRATLVAAWGRRIRRHRKSVGLSQARLAEVCGVAQGTISKIERGTLEPGFELQWKLAGALGRSMDELFSYPAVVPPFPGEAA